MAGVVVVASGGRVENGLIKTVDADCDSSIGSIRVCIFACSSGLFSKPEIDVAFAKGERKSRDDCIKELDDSRPKCVEEALVEKTDENFAPIGDDGHSEGGD